MVKLYGRAKVGLVETLAERVWGFFESESALHDDSFLKEQMESLKSLAADLSEAIKRNRVESGLDELDAKRDAAFRSLCGLVKGYTFFPNDAKSAAAARLKKTLDKYGSAALKTYAEETALLGSLLGEFAAQNADVAALDGVEILVSRLKDAQSAFEAEYLRYSGARAEFAQKASAVEVKKLVVAVVNDKIAPYLDAMRVANADKYSKMAAMFESEVRRSNSE